MMNGGDDLEELVNGMFNVYLELIKQEDEEQGGKIEQVFISMFNLMSEKEQIKCKKEALIKLLQEL
ncbi:hypothetical protein I8F94_14070 [Enterococcus gallinarum]|uniref:hypothetical protein n=1 Tax=Enterococcus faecium TaxID=1352 RepID=UPI001BD80DC8|nr:hypothetical protein [Enterococcus faecium]MBR8696721.1 hypothetical protein [Enterococcus gallinarum]